MEKLQTSFYMTLITLNLGFVGPKLTSSPKLGLPADSKDPAVYKAYGTSLGYSDLDRALESFQMNGGEITPELLSFTDAFQIEDEIITGLKSNLIGYRYAHDERVLYIGIREEKEDTSKIYEIPIASLNPNIKIKLILNKGNDRQVNEERFGKETSYILHKPDLQTANNKPIAA